MNAPEQKPAAAWQPITPRGVAAFAHANPVRLRVAQVAVALLVMAMVLWFVSGAWYPVVREAVTQMPETGGISDGQLDWKGPSPVRLAENRYLSIAVDLEHEGLARSPSHLQVEFGRQAVKIFALLGYVELPYRADLWVGLNRPEAEPWWGAWSPMILVIIGLVVVPSLLVAWMVLATLYMPVTWLVGFFANRDLNWRASWRLSAAALLPGALLMLVVIFIYGMGAWGLLELGLATAVHMVVGWLYLLYCPFLVPRLPAASAARKNPFKQEPAT